MDVNRKGIVTLSLANQFVRFEDYRSWGWKSRSQTRIPSLLSRYACLKRATALSRSFRVASLGLQHLALSARSFYADSLEGFGHVEFPGELLLVHHD